MPPNDSVIQYKNIHYKQKHIHMAGCMAGRIVTSKEVAPGVGGPGPGRRAASRYGWLWAVSCELAGR